MFRIAKVFKCVGKVIWMIVMGNVAFGTVVFFLTFSSFHTFQQSENKGIFNSTHHFNWTLLHVYSNKKKEGKTGQSICIPKWTWT